MVYSDAVQQYLSVQWVVAAIRIWFCHGQSGLQRLVKVQYCVVS